MNTRASLLAILLFSSMLTPILLIRSATGATLVVPTEFLTIQEAINAASDGDTIQVLSGTYFERLLVTKSVTLLGQDRTNTIIDGFGNGSVVHVTAPNVVIRSFTIQNGFRGVHLSNVVGGTITDNRITGNSGYGIRLFNSGSVAITRNTVDSNYRGISLGSGSTGNALTSNIVGPNNIFGIRLFNATGNNITGNTVFGNNHGISLSTGSSSNTVNDNTVSTSKEFGIRVYNSTSNSIARNRLSNNFRGIDIFLSGSNILRNNTATGGYNFGVDGDSITDFLQDIDTSNKVGTSTATLKLIYYLVGRNGLTVSPSTFSSIGYLAVVNSANIFVRDVALSFNIQGLLFAYTTRSTITNVQASTNYIGILLVFSSGNTLTGNTVSLSGRFGIFIRSSGDNVLRSNSFNGNRFNFGVKGAVVADYIEDIDTTNVVDQKPVYYLVNQKNTQVPTSAGYVAVVNSTQVTVKDLNVTRNYSGVLLAYSANSTVRNVRALNNTNGIILDHSTSNQISSNKVLYSDDRGIYLNSSSRNFIGVNTVNFTTTGMGVWLQWYSSGNTLRGNTISKNYYGVLISNSSSSNTIDHNNFISNTIQALQDTSSINTWNDANRQGNYWNDYTGRDLNGDGIGDTLVPHLGLDQYPLMNPSSQGLSLKASFEMDWSDYDNNGIIDIVDVANAAFVFDRASTYWDLNLNSRVDITEIALAAYYFGQKFPDPSSYPGKGYLPGKMDQGWKAVCGSLPEPYTTYCMTRI